MKAQRMALLNTHPSIDDLVAPELKEGALQLAPAEAPPHNLCFQRYSLRYRQPLIVARYTRLPHLVHHQNKFDHTAASRFEASTGSDGS
jgi:hypothetical protein